MVQPECDAGGLGLGRVGALAKHHEGARPPDDAATAAVGGCGPVAHWVVAKKTSMCLLFCCCLCPPCGFKRWLLLRVLGERRGLWPPPSTRPPRNPGPGHHFQETAAQQFVDGDELACVSFFHSGTRATGIFEKNCRSDVAGRHGQLSCSLRAGRAPVHDRDKGSARHAPTYPQPTHQQFWYL